MADPERPYTIEEFAASDGYRWRYRRFTPSTAPRAQVVCIHGIQSHGGWYEYSCDKLRQAGFAVSFLDRRGAGMNEQGRGDAPSFRRLLDDISEFLESDVIRKDAEAGATVPGGVGSSRLRLSGTPVFLIAISWGGKLGAALERRHPGLVTGLALLTPGFFARVKPPLGQRLAIACSRLTRPGRFFPIPLNDPELFTASPRWQHFIRDDALGLRQATARLLVESVRLDGYLRLVPKYIRVPVLLMLAEKDRIIVNSRTRQFVESFAATDKEIIEYVGANHTLEFEPDPDRFIRDLIAWIERHLPA